MNSINVLNYLSYSRNHITSFIFLIPLMIIYEFLSFLLFNNKNFTIRNSADSIFRDIFQLFSSNSIYYYSFIFIIFCIYVFLVYRKDIVNYKIRVNYLFCMYIEGAILGFLLLLFLNNNIFHYTVSYYDDLFLTFYLCLGAGIWEEILFRLVLISFLIIIFDNIYFLNNYKIILSLIISSLLFSAFHYIGSGSDVYTHYTFIVRLIGGLLLGLIYLKRGLAVSSMTHLCYDLFLISFPIVKII